MKSRRIFLVGVLLVTAALACNAPLPANLQGAVDNGETEPGPDTLDPELALEPTETNTPIPPTATSTPTPTLTPTSTATAEPNPVSGYVILTNIEENDSYFQAVQILADYRQAEVIRFEDNIFDTEQALKEGDVQFAAVMVKPEILEEFFAFDVFTLAKQVEPGFATDFSYGYITAVSAEDMVAYVQRVIDYEQGRIHVEPVFKALWRTGERAVGGGYGTIGDEMTADIVALAEGMGFSSERVDADQYTKPEILTYLQSAGVVFFNLHGSPVNIECGLQCQGDGWVKEDAAQLENIRFIFASSCYTASVGTYYIQGSMDVENYRDRAANIDPADSVTLGFMRNGTLGYIGHMCMWGRGDFTQLMLQELADDPTKTTGELLRFWYNQPDGPNIQVNHPVPDLNGMDNNQFFYAAVILHGDPAVRIFQ
jgi:hypothetical protein